MASIFDIALRETGGPIALKAFEYQHRIAVRELLRLASEPNCELVMFDSHDDILVRKRNNSGIVVEFIQVKANEIELWKPSDLYSDDRKTPSHQKHLSSLIAKQLNRAVGDDNVEFRIVTRSETNSDLAPLKMAIRERNPDKIKNLKTKITSRFSHLTFPNSRTADDWIEQVTWHVSGEEQAVDDRNLHIITEIVLSNISRSLTPDQSREIYSMLLDRVRSAASIAKQRPEKGCCRSELLRWINGYCARLPVHLPPSVISILDSLERESQARCIGRWHNAGVDITASQALAEDEKVGAFATKWLLAKTDNFLWVNGQFGAGKSLAAERLYQEILRHYRLSKASRIPVFIEAKYLIRPVSEEIAERAQQIGNHLTQGVYVIIDGADERTLQEARILIQDAADYIRAHSESKLLVTSSILEVPSLEPTPLPPIPKEERSILLRHIAGEHFYRLNRLDGKLGSDLHNPFFIIQCARFGGKLSRADLVRSMVNEALNKVEAAIQPAELLLGQMAQWQLDHGSPLVPENVIGHSRACITAVLQTRLIEKRGHYYSFSIECVAQWYASRAIESGLVSTSEIVTNIERLERWQFAIAIALSRADAELADRIMTPLAELRPAFGSMVLRDGLLNWELDQPIRQVEAKEIAHRLRNAIQSWKIGLEPLSQVANLFPVGKDGNLKKISVTCENGFYKAQWHERPDIEVESYELLESRPHEQCEFWGAIIVDHPAWAWKTTHSHIKNSLLRAINPTSLATASFVLARDAAWSEGCKLLRKSDFIAANLSTSLIARNISYGFSHTLQRSVLRQYLAYLSSRGMDNFNAPHPQSDQKPDQPWMWEYFSHDQMTKRANSVYQTAMYAYREVVELLFPNMIARFPRYAAWPFDLRGVVSKSEKHGYVLDHSIFPLAAGLSGKADYYPGTSSEGKFVIETWNNQSRSFDKQHCSWQLDTCSSVLLSIWEDNSAAKIVEGWIKSDLKAVGWD